MARSQCQWSSLRDALCLIFETRSPTKLEPGASRFGRPVGCRDLVALYLLMGVPIRVLCLPPLCVLGILTSPGAVLRQQLALYQQLSHC